MNPKKTYKAIIGVGNSQCKKLKQANVIQKSRTNLSLYQTEKHKMRCKSYINFSEFKMPLNLDIRDYRKMGRNSIYDGSNNWVGILQALSDENEAWADIKRFGKLISSQNQNGY